MKRAFLMAVLAAVCGVACAAEDTNLYYKVFSLAPTLCDRVSGSGDKAQKLGGVSDAELKTFLSQICKVVWPAGSDAIFSLNDRDRMIIRNTQANLNIIEQRLKFSLEGCQIAVECSLVAFRRTDVEKLQFGAGVTKESLVALQKDGSSRLITTACVMTKSGQEATVTDAQELIYPTRMDYEFGTNQVGGASWAVIPCNFEMREVGTLLNVVPEFSATGMLINLMINPRRVALNRWETYEGGAGSKGDSRKIPLRQPVFEVSSMRTQITLEDGETVLLGGGRKQDDDWIQYHFLKAWSVLPKAPK